MRTISSRVAVRWAPIGSLGRARAPQLVLLGQRQRRDRVEAADRAVRSKAGALELVAIEARAVEQIFDLLEVERRVGRAPELPTAPARFRARPSPSGGVRPSAVCRIASSPFAASRKPIGVSASSMQMGDEAGGAREDRDGANEAGRARRDRAASPRSPSRRSSAAACPRPPRPPSSDATAASTERPAIPRSRASAIMRSARGSSGLCSGWP